MSDDQTFDVGGKPPTIDRLNPRYRASMEEKSGYPVRSISPANPRPTIGQTWTDHATGQEVMVVPVEVMTNDMIDAGQAYLSRGFGDRHYPLPGNFNWHEFWSAMLASLRAKEGK